ncbi:MAG TPA: hypothetical protein VJ599_06180 [Nitrososphaeraceae archaeon]|nr:hypothetical protein [Nitrososphaeraceae archaeon]
MVPAAVETGKWFYIVLIILIVGFVITMYFTLVHVYTPVNQQVITSDNSDIFVVVRKEANILVPLSNFFSPKYTKINVDIYFKDPNLRKASFISPPLLASNTSSLLSQFDSRLTEDPLFTRYNLTMRVGHPLFVANYTGNYELKIIYRLGDTQKLERLDNSTSSNSATELLGNATSVPLPSNVPEELLNDIKVVSIPLQYQVNALDFSKPEYFWIIALGVLTSRVFAISKDTLNKASINLRVEELIWIPFSAIITLLIFSSFVDQVKLSADVVMNLSLAFGFGFGFDKVFEAWQKSPPRGT